MHAETIGRFRLVANVNFGRRIVSREDDGKAGSAVVGNAESVDPGPAFGENFVASTIAVKKEGHVTNLT